MTISSASIILLLVMNPLGNLPVFLATLKHIPAKRQKYIILRETFIAACVLVVFLFTGQALLQGFQITSQALGIAGGIILFLIALRMIFPPDKKEEDSSANNKKEPFFVPLAVPLTAGPAAMTTIMLFVTAEPDKKLFWLAAVLLASTACGIILSSAPYLNRVLGERGLIAIERLMGLILIATAIQMFLTGLTTYFQLHV
ncbi:MAG: MarC family protein [Gammaproteobacteria bacterium]